LTRVSNRMPLELVATIALCKLGKLERANSVPRLAVAQ